MNLSSIRESLLSVRLFATACILLLTPNVLRSQDVVPVTTRTSSNDESFVVERVRQLEAELEKHNSKLEQLQRTINQQQLAIQALLERLDKSATTTLDAPATEAIADKTTPATAAPKSTEPQASPLEQRLAKLEGQVLKIGPFRLSGDFRLRFDGIFRTASKAPDPPLEHVQQARARYRLRLNLDTDLYPNLSFHAQLATGPLNNQLSSNQDFTSMTVRHPFAISEAWMEYRPTKSVTLQGGRVQSIFADNSRFIFDDDIRFNGFNEKYVWSFQKNGVHVSNVDFRAGQYILSTPNVAIIAPGSPLARAGEVVGSTGRSA